MRWIDEVVVQEWMARGLMRHANRRLAGLTTVSVLVGKPERMHRLLAECVKAVVRADAVDANVLLATYVTGVGTPDALRDEALELLSRARTLSPSALRNEWMARSRRERSWWLERLGDVPESKRSGAARAWLQRLLEDVPIDDIASIDLLCCWYPIDALPALCVEVEDATKVAPILQLASALPHLPLALLLTPEQLTDCVRMLKPRSRALLEEGLLRDRDEEMGLPRAEPVLDQVRSVSPSIGAVETVLVPEEGEDSLLCDAMEDTPELASLRQAALAANAASREAARAGTQAPEREDASRSLAERFLYEILQRSAVTRDVFELNGLLPFRFGGRQTEVDFVSRDLRLALEVDGYFHFTATDAYRRDRRKDLLLQQRGFLVARVLAEDVLTRTDAVREYIESLVEERRDQVATQGA